MTVMTLERSASEVVRRAKQRVLYPEIRSLEVRAEQDVRSLTKRVLKTMWYRDQMRGIVAAITLVALAGQGRRRVGTVCGMTVNDTLRNDLHSGAAHYADFPHTPR